MSLDALGLACPLLLTVALVGGARIGAGRRRRRLNRALHELRRPLQVLALGGGFRRGPEVAEGALDQALAALDDIDALINGTRPPSARRPVLARPLVESSVERWRDAAARRERALSLRWEAGAAVIVADPARLAQALDNLIANAIEHGGLRVLVHASVSALGLRLRVSTAAAARQAGGQDPRRGHGLAVVERVAAAHLGRFELRRAGVAVEAVLELPLAPEPLAARPIQWGVRPGGRPRSHRAQPDVA